MKGPLPSRSGLAAVRETALGGALRGVRPNLGIGMPARLEAVEAATRRINGEIRRRLPGASGEELSDDIELALSEALANVVRHAGVISRYGRRPSSLAEAPIVLVLWQRQARLVLALANRQHKPFPRARLSGAVAPPAIAQMAEGGYGFFLIGATMDRVEFGVCRGWSVLSLERRIVREGTDPLAAAGLDLGEQRVA